jgi:hypothetical protein
LKFDLQLASGGPSCKILQRCKTRSGIRYNNFILEGLKAITFAGIVNTKKDWGSLCVGVPWKISGLSGGLTQLLSGTVSSPVAFARVSV